MKKVKFITLTIAFICLTIILSGTSYAQTSLRAKTPLTNGKTASNSANTNSGAVENLKNRAATEIDRRITALNKLLTKLSTLKRVSDTQKSSLSTLIQNEISSLNSLKAKIQADTDLATLRTDTKSIVSSHRIFALFMPQVRLLAAADALNTSAAKMTELAGKLETRIATASSSGQNTASLTTLLESMKSNISDAQTQANAVITAVSPLTPDGYPANRTTLITAKQNLQSGHQSLKKAAQDARQIIVKLLTMSVGNNSAGENSSSASSMMKPGAVNNLKTR